MLFFCQSCCRGLCHIRIDDDACAKTQSFSANDRTQYANDLNLVPNQYIALQAQRRLNEINSIQQCKIDVIFSIKTIYMQNSVKQNKKKIHVRVSECRKTVEMMTLLSYFHMLLHNDFQWILSFECQSMSSCCEIVVERSIVVVCEFMDSF